MADDPGEAFDRYARLIESLLPPGGPAFAPVAENEATVQVERGVVLPLVMAGADAERIAKVMDRLLVEGPVKHRVVDAAGHTRPAYPGLLVYAWRRAMEIAGRDLPGKDVIPSLAFRWWGKRLQDAVERIGIESRAGSPAGADALADCAWSQLACGQAGSRHSVFPRLLRSQSPGGAFLRPSPSANPETTWYHELVLLHAVAAQSVRDARCAEAAAQNATYHLNETQPDHATNEPWGLLAFALNPNTRSVADQMLHTVRVQYPHGAQGVTAILLADVLGHLRELRRRRG